MTRCLAGLLTTLFAAPGALAHSELPSDTWCENGRPVVVASFDIASRTLVEAREAEQTCAPTSGGERTCGQFDDDYGTGRRMALRICNVHTRPMQGDFGSVIYMVEYPQSFNADEHHVIFRAEEGLRGSCVRCERPLAAPLPITPDR